MLFTRLGLRGGRRGQRWGLRCRCIDTCTTSSGASPPMTPSLYRLCGDVGTHYSLCCSHDFVCAGGEGEGSRGWVGRRRLRQEAVVQGALGARGGGGGEGHDWIGRRRLMMLRAVVVRGEEGGGGSDGAERRRLMREGCGAFLGGHGTYRRFGFHKTGSFNILSNVLPRHVI